MRDVVRGVYLRIAPGEVVGLVGESRSGKSISALAVMRLLPPGAVITSGRVIFRGRDLRAPSNTEMNRLRGGEIGMIFQDPLTALNPAIRVGRQLFDHPCPSAIGCARGAREGLGTPRTGGNPVSR